LAGLVAVYFGTLGALYVAGYRVYRFPTVGMIPTIQKDERVFGRLSESYRNRVRRFDLVIYTSSHARGQIYVKRVIGLPHERITIDQNGVMIDGQKLSLPSAVSTAGLGLKTCDLVIPDDAVFVLGDHTENSADSRYIGPVSKENLKGYLLFKK
jgi:signal peptidase I